MHRRLWLTLTGLAFLGLILPAQSRNGQTPATDSLHIDVRLVNIVATVTDTAGRYVGGLTADDFVVEDNDVLQKISHFSQDHNVPVSLGILLDTSGSMEAKMRTAIEAVESFSKTIHPDDDIFLITFSGQPVLTQDFTADRDKFSKALRSIQVRGGTSMYDAIGMGLDKVRAGRHDKRAILLISDGWDTSSHMKLDDILQGVRKSELLIYGLGIEPPTFGERSEHVPFPLPSVLRSRRGAPISTMRDTVDMTVLNKLAEASGGRAFMLSDSWTGRGVQIEKVLTQVAEELRSQYTLGYYPMAAEDRRFHKLTIRSRSNYVVRARNGYIATEGPGR